MGVDNQRPPLPAPTEAFVADGSSFRADGFATDFSRSTDRTLYAMPDEGSPVTITTKPTDKLAPGRHQYQTSLLIEYFEAGKAADQLHSRPSVRVRVTPSSRHRRSKTGNDRVDITQTEKDRKHSYTREISLPPSKGGENKMGDMSEVSYSLESSLSGRPPVEVEVLQNASDLSRPEVSQGGYVPAASDITSVPPDGMLDGTSVLLSPNTRRRSRSIEREEQVEDNDKFKGLSRRRSRSVSRERITTQMIMKKLAKAQSEASGKPQHSRHKSISREQSTEGKHSSWRKPSRPRRGETVISGTEPSFLTFDISRRSSDTRSIRSGVSTTSSTNTPKLFAAVEDATKRLIVPEINALKESQTEDKYERFSKDSLYSTSSSEPNRRVSKASNAPNMKIGLNRAKKDPGVVLSSDSARSKKPRRPSRDSGSERSCDRYGSGDAVREDDKLHKKSKDKQLKDVAIAGAVGAGLTAAALRRHDTETSMDRKEGTEKWSKIRSRTGSISKCIGEESQKISFAPLPMQSVLRSSELTRDSIFSADTERPSSSRNTTATRDMSRGTPCSVMSPAPSTPTRTPTASRGGPNRNPSLRGCSASGSTQSDRELSAEEKAPKPLAAAGIGGAAFASQHSLARTPTPGLNESELKYEDRKTSLTPHAHQPTRSAASISSSGRDASSELPELSPNSAANSPSTNASRSRRRPHGVNLGRRSEVSRDEALRDREVIHNEGTATSGGEEDAEKFFEYEHEANDALRAELEEKRSIGYTDESLRSPNPLDYDRSTPYTDDDADGRYRDRVAADQDVHEVGGRPDYVATPAAVESAVASPIDPSTASVRSSQSNSRMVASQPGLQYMQEQHQSSGENTITGQPDNNGERWVALRDQAKRMEECGCEASPTQSEGMHYQSDEQIQMTAIALPCGDPMPGVRHGPENEPDVTTNLVEIQAPARTPGRWSYGPSPPTSTNGIGAGDAAAVEGAAAHLRDDHGSTMTQDRHCQPSVEDDCEDYGQPYQHEGVMYPREHTTPISAGHWKDERYISATQPGYTQQPQMESSRLFEDTGLPDMSGGLVEDGPFVSGGEPRHVRNFSGNSHGMPSPLYDSATGKGLGRIRSKDVVALMDYLTVQDAQHNAHDTEILVTLSRTYMGNLFCYSVITG
ncbi:hypothetical protein B0J12DRAFT_109233 [Macrophomina phaseolina]|uniref:Uncharacterized protein n=1 Tax=Macrophomina phaseolina TaxID=35725 RepID=A0ABQ8G9A3_9PEZI|nr:hypothetical protein B0J12DRAFT_109233 [Macrophomina phaseolina]